MLSVEEAMYAFLTHDERSYANKLGISLKAVFPTMDASEICSKDFHVRTVKGKELFESGVLDQSANGYVGPNDLTTEDMNVIELVIGLRDFDEALADDLYCQLRERYKTKRSPVSYGYGYGSALSGPLHAPPPPPHLPKLVPTLGAYSPLLAWYSGVHDGMTDYDKIRYAILTNDDPARISQESYKLIKHRLQLDRSSDIGFIASFVAYIDPFPTTTHHEILWLLRRDATTHKRVLALRKLASRIEESERQVLAWMPSPLTLDEIASHPKPSRLISNLPWSWLEPLVKEHPIELNNLITKRGITSVDPRVLSTALVNHDRRPSWMARRLEDGRLAWIDDSHRRWKRSIEEPVRRAWKMWDIWQALRKLDDIAPIRRWIVAECLLNDGSSAKALLRLDPVGFDLAVELGIDLSVTSSSE